MIPFLITEVNYVIQGQEGVYSPAVGELFGLKLGSFYNEFKRNLKRLELAIEEISICSI